jgi:hypothetical protein
LLLGAAVLGTLYGAGAQAQSLDTIRNRLVVALAGREAAQVRACADALAEALGSRAGEPEVPDRYDPIPKAGRWLSQEEARGLIRSGQRWLGRPVDWKIGMEPTALKHPLRAVASHLQACLSFARIDPRNRPDYLEWARADAVFLIWAQERGGTGVFPFPAARGRSGAEFEAADRFLARADARGRLSEVTRNGWIVEDDGDGGLQFDNGECGRALFDLYEVTGERRYLASARRAAEWAADRPLVPNWNYNSFSVALLARAYALTANHAWLAAATGKAMIGVLPGQLLAGRHQGRWVDPHNARPAYHYLMVRSLADLAEVMPRNDPARPQIVHAIVLGLKARNADFLRQGAPNRDKAIEALFAARRLLSADPEALRMSLTEEALMAAGALVSEEAREGKHPLGPCEWGRFLEETLGRRVPQGGSLPP